MEDSVCSTETVLHKSGGLSTTVHYEKMDFNGVGLWYGHRPFLDG
jgi:hypothetical protein